ncbi:MAG: Histidine kinase, partial [Campylobacterota bacterium]|nr:Histidine kinase [Campylobacterota bacterium]
IRNLNEKRLKIANQEIINSVDILLKSIVYIRESIANNEMTHENSFTYFSYTNSQLLELVESIKFYSNDEMIQTRIMAFKKILLLQEISGQERALILQINRNSLSEINMERIDTIFETQYNLHANIKTILSSSKIDKKLEEIDAKNANNYFSEARKVVKNSKNDKFSIDEELWWSVSTQRINDYHSLGIDIFSQIVSDIKTRNNELYNSFIYQLIITITTMFVLLFGAYLLANGIDKSLKNLDSGMDKFFNFLNFKSYAPKKIDITSKDELSTIANKINKQISSLEKQLEKDKKFINETTQIVHLMKDGIFYEKSSFEPANPYLINLKTVFNELTELISDKITEQTNSLESLNKTLEDKVAKQTAELTKQIQEITKARDNAIKAENAKDEFLANMSHEIRTPLNAILGFVSILEKRTEDAKSLEYLNIISTSGTSLLYIINDILDFSKIQSSKFTITPRKIDPINEFSNIALLFASKAYEKNISYAAFIDPSLPRSISIDETRVKQIISNLLSNAMKFTNEGGLVNMNISMQNASLIVSVEDNGIGIPLKSQNKIFTPFSQADNSTTRKYGGTGLGLSISSKLAHQMKGSLSFASEESVGSTFTLKIPLAVVDQTPKELVDLTKIQKYKFAILNCPEMQTTLLGGVIKKYLSAFGVLDTIELQDYADKSYDILFFIQNNANNKKATDAKTPAIAIYKSNIMQQPNVKFITPLFAPFTPMSIIEAINRVAPQKIQNIIEEKENSKNEFEEMEIKFSANILIAEDNKTNQLLMSLILDDYGASYDIANNGLEAVKLFKEKKFDLILMDENMPELSGIGALIQIRDYEAKNALEKTPVIAVTANALTTDIEKFLSAGMDGFISKPIDNKLLCAELSKFLKTA